MASHPDPAAPGFWILWLFWSLIVLATAVGLGFYLVTGRGDE